MIPLKHKHNFLSIVLIISWYCSGCSMAYGIIIHLIHRVDTNLSAARAVLIREKQASVTCNANWNKTKSAIYLYFLILLIHTISLGRSSFIARILNSLLVRSDYNNLLHPQPECHKYKFISKPICLLSIEQLLNLCISYLKVESTNLRSELKKLLVQFGLCNNKLLREATSLGNIYWYLFKKVQLSLIIQAGDRYCK